MEGLPERTARTRTAKNGCLYRTVRQDQKHTSNRQNYGQAELDRQNWTGRTGQAELDRQNWKGRKRQALQDR